MALMSDTAVMVCRATEAWGHFSKYVWTWLAQVALQTGHILFFILIYRNFRLLILTGYIYI